NPAAAAVLVQQPVWRVSHLPWLRQYHRAGSRSGRSRQNQVASTGRDRALDQDPLRSEEHTSELQSQSNLVCRLLLEKKKHKSYCSSTTSYLATMSYSVCRALNTRV